MRLEDGSPKSNSPSHLAFTRPSMRRKSCNTPKMELSSKLHRLNFNQEDKMPTSLAEISDEEMSFHPQNVLRSLPILTPKANKQKLLNMFPSKMNNQGFSSTPVSHEFLPRSVSLKQVQIVNKVHEFRSKIKSKRNTSVMYVNELWHKKHYQRVVENVGIKKYRIEFEKAKRASVLYGLKPNEHKIEENYVAEQEEGQTEKRRRSIENSIEEHNKLEEKSHEIFVDSPDMGILETAQSPIRSPTFKKIKTKTSNFIIDQISTRMNGLWSPRMTQETQSSAHLSPIENFSPDLFSKESIDNGSKILLKVSSFGESQEKIIRSAIISPRVKHFKAVQSPRAETDNRSIKSSLNTIIDQCKKLSGDNVLQKTVQKTCNKLMNHKEYHFHQTLQSLKRAELLDWCQRVIKGKQEKKDARQFKTYKRN